jgi:hypothetical protein
VGLADNPLLTMLGRRGRGAVVEALRAGPGPWTIRTLARAAGVAPMTASRAVRELAALGIAEAFRPGRDHVVRWRRGSAGAAVLAALTPPDLRAEGCAVFAAAYARPGGALLVRWWMPDDAPADPLTPARIAVIVRRAADEEAALDAIGPALDAVEAAGWARPEATVHVESALHGRDDVARAIRAGTPT